MDSKINGSRPTAPVRNQEITIVEAANVVPHRRPQPRNPELEQMVRNLMGEGSPNRTSAHRTTVHGPVVRNNHR